MELIKKTDEYVSTHNKFEQATLIWLKIYVSKTSVYQNSLTSHVSS